ncbi:MAG TPA: xanthine dehydrogenase family protein molybdopterin-binding subunit, partial [Alphaproteobacteria bacterium]|nr:xanthine dehydrogenase family protein molybdopterin-binding subunit [Alphaproteobacteria bacterium]
MKFGIGQPVTRLEDTRLLTGGGRYTDDLAVEGMAYGYVLRSPHAHADIRSVDAGAAAGMPGVLLVLTAAEAAADGIGDLPCLMPLKNRDGSDRGETPRPLLARDRVRHVGEPVAFVVAETLAQARDAAEAIEVDYAERPAVVDTRHAADPGQPQLWDGIPDNLCFDWENGTPEPVEEAFARATRFARVEVVNNRVVSNPMEPRSVLAEYDAASDRSTLHTPSQSVHLLLPQLAEQVLKIGKEKLRVLSPDVGGGFGTRAFLNPEQCLSVWASRRLKRPVKWTGERSEIFMSDAQGRDNVSVAEMAMDDEGRFLGLRVTTYAALGAYLSNFAPFIPTGAGTHMVTGLYDIPAAYVQVKGVLTNTVPTDAYRGAGRPEAAYLIERLVEEAAREIGVGSDEIRRRNFVAPEAMPYKTALGNVYDSGEFAAIMEEAMAKADWAGFPARREQAKARGKLRGIGMGCYIERCGGGNPETAIVEFNEDDSLTVVIGNQHNGQGHATTYTQILCDRLGIEPGKVRFVQGDSDRVPWGMTGGSRAAPVGGAAVLGAADTIIEKGKLVAGHLLEAAAVDIEYADGEFAVAGTDRRVGLFEA